MVKLNIFLLIFLFSNLYSEHYFANYLKVGSSLTYIRNGEKDIYGDIQGEIEYTWNINLGIPLNKRLFTGLQLLNIYASEIGERKKYYAVYGLFNQYQFVKTKTFSLFAETSFNRGNYCTCNNIPFKKKDLYYLGIGSGTEIVIPKIKNLSLDLSFIFYEILNKIQGKYSYTQYIIGINYKIIGR